MKRLSFTFVMLAAFAAPAPADVTIKQTTTGKGMGMSGTMPGATYIKGMKMRTESAMGETTHVTILDKQMADTGGVPYITDMQVSMDGEGPMAGMMAKMGGLTMTTTVESVQTGPLADDLFTPPAGYQLNARK